MKLFLPRSPVVPGEGKADQYMPLGRSITSVPTSDHSQLTKPSGESASSQAPGREEADRLTATITRHLSSERQYLYPAVAALAAVQGTAIADCEIEHDRTFLTDLASLRRQEPGSQTFRHTAQAVETGLRHHIHACETGLFPMLPGAVSKADLVRIGNRAEVAQEAAPSRPYPRGPMRPPWNKLTDAASGAVDKLRDLASGRKTYLEIRPVPAGTKVADSRAK